jgi:hypothetical protein
MKYIIFELTNEYHWLPDSRLSMICGVSFNKSKDPDLLFSDDKPKNVSACPRCAAIVSDVIESERSQSNTKGVL